MAEYYPSDAHVFDPKEPPSKHLAWKTPLSQRDVDLLRIALANAEKELDMQKYLENNRKMLIQGFAGSQGHWVMPQVLLGRDLVADFIVGHRDSMGYHWTVVELEAPNARIFRRIKNEKRKELGPTLLHAIDQIEQRRQWFRENREYARNLGLIDIHEQVPGLIIVGRKEGLDSWGIAKLRFHESKGILIRPYDWLVEEAQQQVDSAEPPPAWPWPQKQVQAMAVHSTDWATYALKTITMDPRPTGSQMLAVLPSTDPGPVIGVVELLRHHLDAIPSAGSNDPAALDKMVSEAKNLLMGFGLHEEASQMESALHALRAGTPQIAVEYSRSVLGGLIENVVGQKDDLKAMIELLRLPEQLAASTHQLLACDCSWRPVLPEEAEYVIGNAALLIALVAKRLPR